MFGAADSPPCPQGPDILVLFRFEKRNVIFPFGSSSRNGKRGTHSHPPTAWCQVFVPPSRDPARCCASAPEGGTALGVGEMQPARVPVPRGAGLMKSSQAFFFSFFFLLMHLQPPASVIYAHPHAFNKETRQERTAPSLLAPARILRPPWPQCPAQWHKAPAAKSVPSPPTRRGPSGHRQGQLLLQGTAVQHVR